VKENGTQVAIQTIYRELDRARTFIKKPTKQEDEQTDEFEEDWTIVEDGEEIDVPHPYEVPSSPVGMGRNAHPTGGGSSVLGSMIFKGAGAQKRT
jgi:sterol 3beta-glucosyltransferase